MFAMQNTPCEFTQYAHGLSLSSAKDQQDLTAAINASFTLISNCAPDKSGINGDVVGKLRQIVFDTKTHTLAAQPTASTFSTWLPNKVFTLLGYEEGAAGPKNLEGMIIFIAEKLAKLAKLKFGPADDDTFTKYLVVNYRTIHMGIAYLKEYYRRFVPSSPKDNEEETLGRCLNIHEVITASAALIANYSAGEIVKLSETFLSISKANDLLSLEINVPIKKLMSLGKESYREAYIKGVFKEGKHIQFMATCLKIDTDLFPQILVPLSNALEQAYNNRFESFNHQLQEFYLQILNSEYFKELHANSVAQLLEKKKWNESEEELQIRSQSEPVKEALSYIYKKIEQIKKQPITEQERKEQLATFLKAIDDQLHNYSPFKQIFNFALVYWTQTPAENNPGLPFKGLGDWQVRQFVTQVLLCFDDLETVNLSDPACRKKLLECAEPIITYEFSEALRSVLHSPVDLNKLNRWLVLFPEIRELSCWPLIEKFHKVNDIELPFQQLRV